MRARHRAALGTLAAMASPQRPLGAGRVLAPTCVPHAAPHLKRAVPRLARAELGKQERSNDDD